MNFENEMREFLGSEHRKSLPLRVLQTPARRRGTRGDMSYEDPAHPPTNTCTRYMSLAASAADGSGAAAAAAGGSEDTWESQAAANLRLCEAEAGLLSARNMWAWMATPANAPGDVGGLFPDTGAFCISNPVRHCARALQSCVETRR